MSGRSGAGGGDEEKTASTDGGAGGWKLEGFAADPGAGGR